MCSSNRSSTQLFSGDACCRLGTLVLKDKLSADVVVTEVVWPVEGSAYGIARVYGSRCRFSQQGRFVRGVLPSNRRCTSTWYLSSGHFLRVRVGMRTIAEEHPKQVVPRLPTPLCSAIAQKDLLTHFACVSSTCSRRCRGQRVYILGCMHAVLKYLWCMWPPLSRRRRETKNAGLVGNALLHKHRGG